MVNRIPSVNEIYDRLVQIRHVMREGCYSEVLEVALHINKDRTWFLVEYQQDLITAWCATALLGAEDSDTQLIDAAQDLLADIETQMRVPA